MTHVFAVYVGNDGRANFNRGLDRLVWGWHDETLNKGRGDNGVTARAMAAGDILMLGTGGPSGGPRVPPDSWSGGSLQTVAVARLTRSLHVARSHVWDDGLYPQRVEFELLAILGNVPAAQLGTDVIELFRRSGTKQGGPVRVPDVTTMLDALSPSATEVDEEANQLNHAGPFSALALTVVRREQQKIRRRKFGRNELATCELCGRTFPTRLLRAAHVKRRSVCSASELDDLSNVIAACVFGCDELFEHGYVSIDAQKRIVVRPSLVGDLRAAAMSLEGRQVRTLATPALKYAEWHRNFHLLGREAGAQS